MLGGLPLVVQSPGLDFKRIDVTPPCDRLFGGSTAYDHITQVYYNRPTNSDDSCPAARDIDWDNMLIMEFFRDYEVLPPSKKNDDKTDRWVGTCSDERIVQKIDGMMAPWPGTAPFPSDGEKFWYYVLLMNKPARSDDQLMCRKKNKSGTFEEAAIVHHDMFADDAALLEFCKTDKVYQWYKYRVPSMESYILSNQPVALCRNAYKNAPQLAAVMAEGVANQPCQGC